MPFCGGCGPRSRPGGQVIVVDIERPTDQHGIPPHLLFCEFAALGFRLVEFVRKPGTQGLLCAFEAAGPRPSQGIRPCTAVASARPNGRRHEDAMEFQGLKPILYGGREVWPLVEGGKGVSATNHASSGAWAAAGGIGTVSAVNADSYDADGKIVPQVYQRRYPRGTARRADPVRHRRRGGTGQAALMTLPAARARSTSTCCGKWAARRQCSKACWKRPRGWSPASPAVRGCPTSCRNRRALQRQLPADHQLGPGIPRAVEAGLSQGAGSDGRGGL